MDLFSSDMTCLFQLVELSKAQDVEAGDGTTSVCVIAGSLLDACQKLLSKGKICGPVHVILVLVYAYHLTLNVQSQLSR